MSFFKLCQAKKAGVMKCYDSKATSRGMDLADRSVLKQVWLMPASVLDFQGDHDPGVYCLIFLGLWSTLSWDPQDSQVLLSWV